MRAAFQSVLIVALAHCGAAFALSRSSVSTVGTAHVLQPPTAANSQLELRSPRSRSSRTATCISASAAALASSRAVVNVAAFKAILKLVGTCGIGAYAGKVGILDKVALGVLSKLIFNIFQPCLLFVNVCQTVSTAGGSAAVWILPAAAGVQILLGYLVGLVVTRVIYGNVESEEKRQTLTCTTFSNSGPLPLVFVDALFRAHPDQTLLPKAVAYISLYLLGWSPLFWIVAPAILSEPGNADGKAKSAEQKKQELLTRIFSPPVIGSLMGLVVGSIPALRKQLIPSSGLLNWLFEAMRTLGTAYLPAVLLVLAGSLTPSQEPAELAQEAAKSEATKKKEGAAFLTQISAIYSARYFLMPAVGFAIMSACTKFIPAAATLFSADKMLALVLLLETCMPSAQNSTVILQLANKKTAAARMARVLMLIYILGIPAISYWLAKVLMQTSLL